MTKLFSMRELLARIRAMFGQAEMAEQKPHNEEILFRVSDLEVDVARRRAIASTAAHFLHNLRRRMPFPIQAIEVDGGSEFEVALEEECRRQNIKLFAVPPCSPKPNGGVERAHRTHTEESYEVTESSFDIAQLRNELLERERTYDAVRPHQVLNYLTRLSFWSRGRKKQGK